MLGEENHRMRELHIEEIGGAVAQLVLGASYGVDAAGFTDVAWFHPQSGVSWEDVRSLGDRRLKLRALISDFPERIITSPHDFKRASRDRIERFDAEGWVAKKPVVLPAFHSLIVDNEVAIFTNLNSPHKDDRVFIAEDELQVDLVRRHFNAAWHGETVLLHQEQLTDPASEDSSVIVDLSATWDRLIAYFAASPERMHDLDPRKFEELVAELLSRENMDVELTPPSKDGGRDVLAYTDSPVGRHLFYVECKKYSEENPVGVSLVRQLYGVLEAERATAGLIVTTSRFTKGALEFQKNIEHRMSLKDLQRLSDWVSQHTINLGA